MSEVWTYGCAITVWVNWQEIGQDQSGNNVAASGACSDIAKVLCNPSVHLTEPFFGGF
jgi:hypothetical protein